MNSNSDFLTIGMYCIGILLLFGCIAPAWADSTTHIFQGIQGSYVALTPCHTGEDYSFTGDYENGQISITGPGEYYLSQNLTTVSTDYAISIQAPDVTLDGYEMFLTGPGNSGIGVNIGSNGSHAVITNFSSVSGFFRGIYSEGKYGTISDSIVHDNHATGISSYGDYSEIIGNFVYNQSDVGIHSLGNYSTITENYASNNRNGILSQGNYAEVSGNAGNDNFNYGIYAGGTYTGPEPGNEGSGYYARIIENIALLNTVGGIKTALPHAIIQDNSVFQNNENGIALTWRSNNTTITGNYISDNPTGINLSDRSQNVSIIQNLIRFDGNSGIYVTSDNGRGSGQIYDNIFSGQQYVNGPGKIGAFSWTNPTGPTPGTNIMDGPFIAGNYWTNSTHTGWSDQQPVNPNGYSDTPYEVAALVYDTAPLVKVKVTPTPTPTPTPIPLAVNFTASPMSGVPPLTVQFTDRSTGSPTAWRWNFGDGTYSTLMNPLHEYKGIGRYTITLEVQNDDAIAIVRRPEFVKTFRPKR